jgi:hypothetical protein
MPENQLVVGFYKRIKAFRKYTLAWNVFSGLFSVQWLAWSVYYDKYGWPDYYK